MLTNADIEGMINIGKSIISTQNLSPSPHSDYDQRGKMSLKGDDGREYGVFIRKNLALAESFSVGLTVVLEDGNTPIIIRYNGKGDPIERIRKQPFHNDWHIHYANCESIYRIKEQARFVKKKRHTLHLRRHCRPLYEIVT